MCCPKFGKNRMKKKMRAGKIGRDRTCRLSPIWLSVEFFWIRWFPNYFPHGTLSKWRILNYGQFAKLPNNSARSWMWFWAGNRISNLIPAKSERKSKQVQEKKIGITLEILKLESDSIWSELMMGFISHIHVHTNRDSFLSPSSFAWQNARKKEGEKVRIIDKKTPPYLPRVCATVLQYHPFNFNDLFFYTADQ